MWESDQENSFNKASKYFFLIICVPHKKEKKILIIKTMRRMKNFLLEKIICLYLLRKKKLVTQIALKTFKDVYVGNFAICAYVDH